MDSSPPLKLLLELRDQLPLPRVGQLGDHGARDAKREWQPAASLHRRDRRGRRRLEQLLTAACAKQELERGRLVHDLALHLGGAVKQRAYARRHHHRRARRRGVDEVEWRGMPGLPDIVEHEQHRQALRRLLELPKGELLVRCGRLGQRPIDELPVERLLKGPHVGLLPHAHPANSAEAGAHLDIPCEGRGGRGLACHEWGVALRRRGTAVT